MERAARRVEFRAIAIVETIATLEIALSVASEAAVPIAIMLRDPYRRAERVRALVDAAFADGPVEAAVIANSIADPRVAWVHLPFAERSATVDSDVGIGVSIHSLLELQAVGDNVEYFVASPVFPTASKPGHAGIGLDALATICGRTSRPVFALGGIVPEGVGACLAAGAFGIAGISSFSDPGRARELLDALVLHITP
jgi:hypothetical protein